jgi:hypothetical protein
MTSKIDARLNEHCKIYYLITQFTHTLVPGNMWVAVGIFIISRLEAQIQVVPVWRPPFRISGFGVHQIALKTDPFESEC